MSLASREHANLILANDPDADRLAVAILWPIFRLIVKWDISGDEIGRAHV